jgi:hypothetical protein
LKLADKIPVAADLRHQLQAIVALGVELYIALVCTQQVYGGLQHLEQERGELVLLQEPCAQCQCDSGAPPKSPRISSRRDSCVSRA